MSLNYTVYVWTIIEIKEPIAESDTHASFESGFRNNSIVQNNNYSFFFYYYQNTPSFLSTSIYFFVCFDQAPLSHFHTAPGESREDICFPLCRLTPSLTSESPSSATNSWCPSPLLHNVVESCGSSPTRASIFLGYTYIHGKTCLLHHLLFKTCMWHRKGWGAKTGVWW